MGAASGTLLWACSAPAAGALDEQLAAQMLSLSCSARGAWPGCAHAKEHKSASRVS